MTSSKYGQTPAESATTSATSCTRNSSSSAGFCYVRLHGADELYTSGYTQEALGCWATRARAWRDGGRDVHIYLDNDAKVFAPRDAIALRARLGMG